MESEDERIGDSDWHTHPYLRLYEKEEHKLRRLLSLDSDSEASPFDPRIYVPYRFFGIIKGFHTGYLDLTGRHQMRYECHIKRFSEFVSELQELDPRAHIPGNDSGEDKLECIEGENVPPDQNLWSSFAQKWGFPSDMEIDVIRNKAQETLAVLRKNPSPIFQRICLTDLPVELLESIMGNASIDQARVLSSTCRLLHEIGSRFVNVIRQLVLAAKPDWDMLRANPNKDFYDHLRDSALASKDKFMSITRFLLPRRDLTGAVEILMLRDGWSHQALHHTLAQSFHINHLRNFYTEIHRDIVNVLQAANKLTTLMITYFEIWPELLVAISHIRTLQSVSFLGCQCINWFISEKNESVLNLRILLPDAGGGNVRFATDLYPQLRTLSIMGSSNVPVPLSGLMFADANPFLTLERVSLSKMDPLEVWSLSTWMGAADMGLKLTHLKVETASGMPEEGVFDLIQALGMAPNLQVLVLEGLESGSLDLITLIATMCSNLLGLTLIRRHNARQCRTKLALWPHTLAEYASRFSSFTRLRYFAWNSLVSILPDPTPTVMILFENGFPDLDTEEGWMEWHDVGDVEYFDDSYLIAAPFAAHCPTLETYVITVQVPFLVCKIDRSKGAVEITTPLGSMFGDSETRGWNTEIGGSWPNIMHKQIV